MSVSLPFNIHRKHCVHYVFSQFGCIRWIICFGICLQVEAFVEDLCWFNEWIRAKKSAAPVMRSPETQHAQAESYSFAQWTFTVRFTLQDVHSLYKMLCVFNAIWKVQRWKWIITFCGKKPHLKKKLRWKKNFSGKKTSLKKTGNAFQPIEFDFCQDTCLLGKIRKIL